MLNNTLSILAMSDTAQWIVMILIIVVVFGAFFGIPIASLYFDPHTMGYNKNELKKVDEEGYKRLGGNTKRLDFANIVLGNNGIYFRPDKRRDGYCYYIPYDKIAKYHIAYQPTTTTRSGAGGAIVGGVLFGVVGAIAGGLATRRQLNSIKELILVIHTNDGSSYRIDFIDGEHVESVIKNRVAEYEQLRAYLDNHDVPYTQEVLPSLP